MFHIEKERRTKDYRYHILVGMVEVIGRKRDLPRTAENGFAEEGSDLGSKERGEREERERRERRERGEREERGEIFITSNGAA